MKSSGEDLKNRGFADKSDIDEYSNNTIEDLYCKLNSDIAAERSAAVINLRTKSSITNEKYTKLLLDRLSRENALYTKIELCNTLEMGNEQVADIMCSYLGTIGINQHKAIPDSISKKKSYPLPRDVIARTLGKMDKSLIDVLMRHLELDHRDKISELIDAIGYMIFYNTELATDKYFNHIKNAFDRYAADEFIVWKIALCCSAFPLTQSVELLNYMKDIYTNQTIISETERSLERISTILVNK